MTVIGESKSHYWNNFIFSTNRLQYFYANIMKHYFTSSGADGIINSHRANNTNYEITINDLTIASDLIAENISYMFTTTSPLIN